jgi:2-keto-4-pentenoate hydratase/2-oxohepta-3-ene-1,7-dioic acid hydratase in catechol pathway
MIVELERGSIVATGTYDGLMRSRPGFRRMVEAST